MLNCECARASGTFKSAIRMRFLCTTPGSGSGITYRWNLASLEGSDHAIELKLAIDIGLLLLNVGRLVDLRRHDDDGVWVSLGILGINKKKKGMECRARYSNSSQAVLVLRR
jgi:hypothetical protein